MVELKDNDTLIGAIDLGTSSTRFLVILAAFFKWVNKLLVGPLVHLYLNTAYY